MTVKELYKWAVENECEDDNLLIADAENTAWKINEDMLTTIQYEGSRFLNKVVISL